jgi:hypothetical protein
MSESKAWLRRQALALVSTLPEDLKDARAVLELANVLVEQFLEEKPETIREVYNRASQLQCADVALIR